MTTTLAQSRQAYDVAMMRALGLAAHGPAWGGNPRVGCLILDATTGQTLAEGYHHGAGTDHAEVDALKRLPAGTDAHGAVMIVSLEPCRHQGRTGPCTTAIIAAGIGTVVYGASDPSAVAGGGAEELAAAGIDVIGGVRAAESEALNRYWFTSERMQRPFVTVKWAATLDGRIAAQDGSSQWISGPESRAHAHVARAEADGIIVGTGTVIDDDPALTARRPDGTRYEHQPTPIVIGHRDLPPAAKIYQNPHPLLQYRNHTPAEVLDDLFTRGFRHVLVEGGPTTTSAFVGDQLVDEFTLYLAPKLLGGWRVSLTQIGVTNIADAHELIFTDVERLGDDIFVRATPKHGIRPPYQPDEV